jgi:hypothetical protein
MRARSVLAVRCGVALILATSVAACGGAADSPVSGQGPTLAPVAATPAGPGETGAIGATTGATTGATGATGATTGHLGDTLTYTDLAGDQIDVTLVRLTDPASPTDANNAAVAGSRWVGLQMTIDNHEIAPSDDSVQADGTGSDGQRYGFNTSYHIGGFDGCTATVASAAAGQTATFCAGFMVPTGVTVVGVGYSVAGADIGAPDDLTWIVP